MPQNNSSEKWYLVSISILKRSPTREDIFQLALIIDAPRFAKYQKIFFTLRVTNAELALILKKIWKKTSF